MTTLKELRIKIQKNLQILRIREAKQGGEAELRLINQIEDHQKALKLIDESFQTELTERRLAALKEALQPLLIDQQLYEGVKLGELKAERPRQPFEPKTVLIPAGPFLMGRSPDEGVDKVETPQHEVTLETYEIGVYPITNAEYAEFLKQNRLQARPKKGGWSRRTRLPPADKMDHPVVGVNWLDAVAYCDWLRTQTGRLYRLPTEAEWEKAASWDTTGAEKKKRLYPWGDEWNPENCNTEYSSGQVMTTAVTAYPAGTSPYGCYDMVGNIQEWTQTIWGTATHTPEFLYPYRADDGREELEGDKHLFRAYRVQRGGPPTNLSCTARSGSDQDGYLPWRGFRVVRAL